MDSKQTELLVSNIQNCLRNVSEYEIETALLFGSQASRNTSNDSDVDLIVVLNRDNPFKSFRERMEVIIAIRQQLSDISKEYGLDLLVYSKPEWEDYLKKKSAFSREIESTALKVA